MIAYRKTSLALFALFLSSFAAQAEPLDRTVAAKLIAEAEQIRVNEVVVGPLQKVHRQIDQQTTATTGVCATFIAPKVSDGIRRRMVQYRTFYYDADWGWYLYAVTSARGGDKIDVVSQHKGRFHLR